MKTGISKLLLLILAITWLFWIPAGFLSKELTPNLINILHYTGGAVPLIGSLIYLFSNLNTKDRKDYLSRLIDIKRIDIKWFFVIIFLLPCFVLISSLIDNLFGGNGISFAPLNDFRSNPFSIISYAFFILIFGPVPEEMAWRGLVLDRMEREFSPFKANLFLGFYWLIWHLPLFFIDGSYQAGLGIGTPQFWLFILDKVPYTFLLAWIFHHTKSSTFAAILFHFVINFLGEIMNLSTRAETFFIILLHLSMILIICIEKDNWFEKKKTLINKEA